jgi:nitroreductase
MRVEFYEALRQRTSVRSYSSEAVPEDVLERVLEAVRIAPSANNQQPWRLILVQEAETRAKLARLCFGQSWIADAAIVVVACGVPTRGGIGGYASSRLVDVAIAVDHLTLAAAAEGLGTCWIGAFDNDGLKELLGIPAEADVVAVTPLGYPQSAVASPAKHRHPMDRIVSWGRWGPSA